MPKISHTSKEAPETRLRPIEEDSPTKERPKSRLRNTLAGIALFAGGFATSEALQTPDVAPPSHTAESTQKKVVFGESNLAVIGHVTPDGKVEYTTPAVTPSDSEIVSTDSSKKVKFGESNLAVLDPSDKTTKPEGLTYFDDGRVIDHEEDTLTFPSGEVYPYKHDSETNFGASDLTVIDSPAKSSEQKPGEK